MKLVLNYGSALVIVFAFLFLLTIVYWSVYPYSPATFNALPHRVDKKIVHGGDFIVLYIDVCKNMDVVPEISRVFVDGVIYQIPTYVTTNDEQGCRVRRVQIYVPKGLPPSTYKISTTFRFRVNPIRVIEMYTDSEKFEVTQ